MQTPRPWWAHAVTTVAALLTSALLLACDVQKPEPPKPSTDPAAKVAEPATKPEPNYLAARYDKMHLFAFDNGSERFDEGRVLEAGDTPVALQAGALRVGLSVCYDLRFPELFRRLGENHPLDLIVLPAAFTDTTGRAHWELLLRARAVENQFYVATAGMTGSLPLITDLTAQYAQSGIYTPADFPFPVDGLATEAAPTAEMVIVADVDLALLDQARARGSVLNHQDAAQDGLHVRFDGTIQVHRLPWSETSGPVPASQA